MTTPTTATTTPTSPATDITAAEEKQVNDPRHSYAAPPNESQNSPSMIKTTEIDANSTPKDEKKNKKDEKKNKTNNNKNNKKDKKRNKNNEDDGSTNAGQNGSVFQPSSSPSLEMTGNGVKMTNNGTTTTTIQNNGLTTTTPPAATKNNNNNNDGGTKNERVVKIEMSGNNETKLNEEKTSRQSKNKWKKELGQDELVALTNTTTFGSVHLVFLIRTSFFLPSLAFEIEISTSQITTMFLIFQQFQG